MKSRLKNLLLAGSSVLVLGSCDNSKANLNGTLDAAHAVTTPAASIKAVADAQLKNMLTEPHPLEAVARNIDPHIHICVIPQGDWADSITHGTGFNYDYGDALRKSIPNAALARFQQYFPQASTDKTLGDALETIAQKTELFDNSTSATAFDSKGQRYVIVILGSVFKTPKDYFDFFLDGDRELSERAASQHPNMDISHYSQWLQYHELGHAFDSKTDSFANGKKPAQDLMYFRHQEEMHGSALGELKLLQQTDDIKQIQLDCDLRILSGFYNTSTVDWASVTYFSHKMFDNIKRVYDESGHNLKNLSDGQLLKLSERVAEKSTYSLQEFNEIQASFAMAQAELRRHSKNHSANTSVAVSNEKKSEIFAVTAAVRKGLLNKSKPYNIKLLQAEQRVFGLHKNHSPVD